MSAPLDPDWCREPPVLRRADRGWCDSPPPSCPGLVEACASLRAAEAEPPPMGCDRSADAGSASPPNERTSARVELPQLDARPPTLADGAAGWALLGLVLLAVVVALLRRGEPADEAQAEAAGEGGAEAGRSGPLDAPGAGATAGWRDAAEQALRAGRPDVALLLARAAVVATLERRGDVAADPGRTDRELVRASPEGDTREAVRQVVQALERLRYARAPVDPEVVRKAVAAAARVAVGAALLAWAHPAHARPSDRELLAPFLLEHGHVLEAAEGFAEEPAFELWEPGDAVSDEDVARLEQAVAAGSTVFVFGEAVLPRLERLGLQGADLAVGPVRGAPGLTGRPLWPELELPRPGRRLDAAAGAPLLVDARGAPVAVELRVGQGFLVVVANDDLLDDASLLHPGNAQTLLALLALPPDAAVRRIAPVPAAPTAADHVVAAGFGLAFLQLGVLWALWAWSGGRAFAARQPFEEQPAREFALHLDAVARFYAAAGADAAAWRAVASRALHRLRVLTGADDARLAEVVAARLGIDPAELRPLIQAAQAAATAPPPPDPLHSSERLWNLVSRLQATKSVNSPSSSPR